MLSIPPMRLNRNKHLSELVWLAILCFLSHWCARRVMGPSGWWLWVSSNKPVQKLKSLSSPKKQHFRKERQNKHTKGLCLLPLNESFLTPCFPLPLGFLLTLRLVLVSDPWMLKIDCSILRKTHRDHYNTANTQRGDLNRYKTQSATAADTAGILERRIERGVFSFILFFRSRGPSCENHTF